MSGCNLGCSPVQRVAAFEGSNLLCGDYREGLLQDTSSFLLALAFKFLLQLLLIKLPADTEFFRHLLPSMVLLVFGYLVKLFRGLAHRQAILGM